MKGWLLQPLRPPCSSPGKTVRQGAVFGPSPRVRVPPAVWQCRRWPWVSAMGASEHSQRGRRGWARAFSRPVGQGGEAGLSQDPAGAAAPTPPPCVPQVEEALAVLQDHQATEQT